MNKLEQKTKMVGEMGLERYAGCFKHRRFNEEKTRGRRKPQDSYGYMELVDPFVFDIDQLLNAKASRRLDDKTQVFPSPDNPHVRTRSIHTREVVAFSLIAADIMGLNTRLVEAIALGHDIGHAPYGHLGEEVISEVTGKTFRHEIFSVVVAQYIEKQEAGLNLSFETLEGILHHSKGGSVLTVDSNLPLEYALVMFADKIAYTFSDVEDIIRYGLKGIDEFPPVLVNMGANQRERVTRCLGALVAESAEAGEISFFKSKVAGQFEELRQWLYRNVYFRLDHSHNRQVLKKIYEFLGEFPYFEGCDPAILLALLTDKEANRLSEMFLKQPVITVGDLHSFGIMEIAPYVRDRQIDFEQPRLEWGVEKD
ncbi:MAG: Deoxyguanosinetriphosphate triphosphohydrolase [bacterium ADurb.Bin400]|nr:MAG: Deoxyguanosinetriphosphate triphosphohydrolase [bacterium ADurb.Bin400]